MTSRFMSNTMKSITDGKRGTFFFQTGAAANYLGISPKTFRIHRRFLGIEARKMTGRRGKWFTAVEVIAVGNLVCPPRSLWAYRLEDRLRLFEESAQTSDDDTQA